LRTLARRGVSVHVFGGWNDQGYWGEARTQLLNRARILLNLSRHPGLFAGDRLVLGMANGALVVSEPIYRPEPFVPGKHFVVATIEEMPDEIERYLDDEEARARIARQGYEFVTREVTLERAMTELLGLIERRIARHAV
jgi:glycosyltransferase involved in cell wall biosynthesis